LPGLPISHGDVAARLRKLLAKREAPVNRNSAIIPILLVSAATLASAQAPDAADKQARLAALKQSIADNQAALKQYTWVETTVISLKGEVKKQEQKQCAYGADGKVQKTPMPGAAPEQKAQQQGGGKRGGRMKQRIVENKVDEMKAYMEKAAALVKEYVPPDPQRIQAVQAAGNVDLQPPTLTFKSYYKPQDSLALGFDPAAKKIRTYNVNSYVEDPKDDVVTLAVTFGSLDDGTSYPQQVVLDVKNKNIQVKVDNAGYKKK
jgi:hypothetical protein